jgi:lipoyl(octanoyl) transferase
VAATEAPDLWVVRSGQVPYEYARDAQRVLAAARSARDLPDLLLLLEHPPVYTKGRRSSADELPMGEDWYRMQGIAVCETDRGGRVTYHGPGQLVGYPIVGLADLPARDDVHAYVRDLERAMIAALAEWGIAAGPITELTGVWTDGRHPRQALLGAEGEVARKIGSIGVHVNRGVTTHGFAINVANDLQPFEWIVPCGIEGCRMTSVTRELGTEQDVGEFADTVAAQVAETYGRRPVEVHPARLAELIEGTEALAAAMPAAIR